MLHLQYRSYGYDEKSTPVDVTKETLQKIEDRKNASWIYGGDTDFNATPTVGLTSKIASSEEPTKLGSSLVTKQTIKQIGGIYSPYGFKDGTSSIVTLRQQDKEEQAKIDESQNEKIENAASGVTEISFDANDYEDF